jgi:hypothetical protein
VLSDAEEIALGTNPLQVDSDFDGLTDGLEFSYQGDPLSNQPPGTGGLQPGFASNTSSGQFGQALDPAGGGHLEGGAADLH